MSFAVISCNQQETRSEVKVSSEESQQIIIDEALKNAYAKGMNSREFQLELNKGLAKDSTIAYLWQQKSMPLYKQGKYELGKPFLDKAVLYNRDRYLDYRAFMMCIFEKNYREAIKAFEQCIAEYGNSYVMDHTYKCYIGMSYLMLNEFEMAEAILLEDISEITEKDGEDWVHHLELFYYGISLYEQQKFDEAISVFNKALAKYPTFSDVQFYKALCLQNLNKKDEAEQLMAAAAENAHAGNTINEDNVIYERYPYQVRLNTYSLYETK